MAKKQEESTTGGIVICVADTATDRRAVAMHVIKELLAKSPDVPLYVHTGNNELAWMDFAKKHAEKQFCRVSASWSGERVYTDDREKVLASKGDSLHKSKLLSVLDFNEWDWRRMKAVEHPTRTEHYIVVLTGESNPMLAAKCNTLRSHTPVLRYQSLVQAERPFYLNVADLEPHQLTADNLKPFRYISLFD